jgi:ABC-type antimicrobial peptide transport system permease subunit
VVENVRQWGPTQDPRPEIYWTPEHAWGRTLNLVLRSPQNADFLANELRRLLAELDPDLPLGRVRTFQTVVDEATKGSRAITSLVDCFMAVALILVSVGLYGTLSYHVFQRTREIGVRMALGADASGIILLVARQGANWVLSGLALGALAALGLASLVKSMIYGVGPINSFAMGIAGLCVMVAAGFACWLPARRASKLDPVVALRSD